MNTNDNNGLRPNEEYLEEAKYDDILQRKINYYGETKAAYQCAAEEYGMKALDLLREDMKEKMIDFHIAAMKEGLLNEGDATWKAFYEPKIRGIAKKVFNELYVEPPSTKQEGEEKCLEQLTTTMTAIRNEAMTVPIVVGPKRTPFI